MAVNFPGRKFFTGTDARSRIFLLLVGLMAVGLLIYLGVRFLGGAGGGTTGPSKVAGTPQGLTSVPGGQLSPEYYRALEQANAQSAQKAQMTGGSAVPTLMNVPNETAGGANCTILCPNEEAPNVVDDLNSLVKSEKLSKNEADQLADLAKKNVSVEEYAAALADLVRQGKLTPEQARALLDKYKKQHENALLKQSASSMDPLIKAGQLPLEVANDLLEMQKRKLTPAEYAAELQRLVREGKLSPEAAAALLAQYNQQYQHEKALGVNLALQKMAEGGELTPETSKLLQDMMDKALPLNQFKTNLDGLVTQGKLTPVVAAKILGQYQGLRQAPGASGLLGGLLGKGGAYSDEAKKLLQMQANGASLEDYANELKRAVAAGILSPDEAAELLRQYQAMMTVPTAVTGEPTVSTQLPTTEEFAALAARVQQAPPVTLPPPNPAQAAQFAEAAAAAQAQAEQAREQRIEALQTAMTGQAQSLMAAWQPPAMQHREGSPVERRGGVVVEEGGRGPVSGREGGREGGKKPVGKSLIKAGTIYFAILDTGVNSDYPDTPVLATIIQGPYKGAKVLGKLALAQGMDKVSLNFTLMDMDAWPETRTISAFAIDPDTARTVMASEVDHHYLEKYGAIMATSFLTGYSGAVTNAGTSTTGIFGTSTTHGSLSPGNKIAVGLGQVGTALTNVVQNFVNTPTTVKITAGVGLGILFTTAVTE